MLMTIVLFGPLLVLAAIVAHRAPIAGILTCLAITVMGAFLTALGAQLVPEVVLIPVYGIVVYAAVRKVSTRNKEA